jgi:hypothetical protein
MIMMSAFMASPHDGRDGLGRGGCGKLIFQLLALADDAARYLRAKTSLPLASHSAS